MKLRFRIADGAFQQLCDFVMAVPMNYMKSEDFPAAGREVSDRSMK
jgi:hypothetical protein